MSARQSRHSPLAWRKSSHSDAGTCIEIARRDLSILVRDTRHRSGTVLAFTPAQWSAFVGRVRGCGWGITGHGE